MKPNRIFNIAPSFGAKRAAASSDVADQDFGLERRLLRWGASRL